MLLIVIGTRPEAIKFRSLILALKKQEILFKVVYTGQQLNLEQDFFNDLGIQIDITLPRRVIFDSITEELSRQISQLAKIILEEKPHAVAIQGDTTTTLAAALAARLNDTFLLYLESGLRTNDDRSPFPEEINRKLASTLASINFTPTVLASNNLRAEGIPDEKILKVGNTVVDSLRLTLDELTKHKHLFDSQLDLQLPFIFISCHRRELAEEHRLALIETIKDMAESLPQAKFIFSLHPNPKFSNIFREKLANIGNVELKNGLNYIQTIACILKSSLIITDSGGIQEEAASLSVPLIVFREKTERPECLSVPTSKLVRPSKYSFAAVAIQFMQSFTRNPLPPHISDVVGDGYAAHRIVDWYSKLIR